MLAVIQAGSKQYLVEPGQSIKTELVGEATELTFEPLLVIDGETVHIGTPLVAGAKVVATVTTPNVQDDKVMVLKYKAKKRQKTLRGHRQRYSVLEIKTITA